MKLNRDKDKLSREIFGLLSSFCYWFQLELRLLVFTDHIFQILAFLRTNRRNLHIPPPKVTCLTLHLFFL